MRYDFFFAEGPHDIMALYRLLKIRGFRQEKLQSGIPAGLQKLIPTRFPFSPDTLDQIVAPCPVFMCGEERWALLISAGGDTKLVGAMNRAFLALDAETFSDGVSIGIVLDADNKPPQQRRDALKAEANKYPPGELRFQASDFTAGNGKLYGYDARYTIYVLPNDEDSGVLEDLLLDGLSFSEPGLVNAGRAFVEAQKVGRSAGKNESAGKKATVGVIGNLLRPGRANTATIHDDTWITPKTITEITAQKMFDAFVLRVLA